jgi:hypothetical protein
MLWLTEDAVVVCKHELGIVQLVPTQDLVFVDGRRVLVDPNPEGRPIKGCPNIGATIKPCLVTLKVEHGYSEWLRIEGQKVCLDTVTGLTDGTPPGVVEYKVRTAGQLYIEEKKP